VRPTAWPTLIGIALLASGVPARAEDDFTLYELLPPESHRFAITYDVATRVPSARFFFNPIREGSVASDERVIDRASGKELLFSIVKGKEAKASGLVDKDTKDEADFIRVELATPVPKGGERRIRILKTYTDARSYFAEGNLVVFDRSLSIRRNAIVLPPGYELVGCSVPAIVSTEAGGRVKVSVVNDRDDSLAVRVTGRLLPAPLKSGARP
jgi:hypothetical protein